MFMYQPPSSRMNKLNQQHNTIKKCLDFEFGHDVDVNMYLGVAKMCWESVTYCNIFCLSEEQMNIFIDFYFFIVINHTVNPKQIKSKEGFSRKVGFCC